MKLCWWMIPKAGFSGDLEGWAARALVTLDGSRRRACSQIECREWLHQFRPRGQLRQAHTIDVPCQTNFFQNPNTVPVDVELIPGKAMPRRDRMSVMVVVPAFAESEKR